MKKFTISSLIVIVFSMTSCYVTKQSYQPVNQRSASSYSEKEKMDYLNEYGIIEYRKKFGY